MSATNNATDRNLPLLHKAREQIANGELKNAAITLNQANKTVPGDARVFMLGGLMAEKAGNAKGAQESMRRAVKLAPDWAPGQLELALLLARMNQFGPALEAAETALKLEPNNLRVLAGCIDVAHRAGNLGMAMRLLRRGLELVPNDPQLTLLLANDLHATQQHDEALGLWNQLLTDHPDHPDALFGRLKTSLAVNDLPTARLDVAKLLQMQPDSAVFAYFSELAHGRTPPQQPEELNRQLFDHAADTFDQHLVQTLRYRLPKLVADRLLRGRPDRRFNVLDLGCGTGLLGACLGRLQGALVGVEISPKMIEQAARHGVYDKIHTVNLHDALEATPANLYEVIAALDVFIYAGDLHTAIPNAHRILVPGGQLVLSCETAAEDGPEMVLNASGRYAHKRSHAEALCVAAGYTDLQLEDLELRQENGKPVPGFIVWARKAA